MTDTPRQTGAAPLTLNPQEIVLAIAELLIPGKRDAALERLRAAALFSPETADRLAHKLSIPNYKYRGMARHLVPVKMEIDAFVARNRFCVLSPAKLLDQIPRQMTAVAGLDGAPDFSEAWLTDRTVLDFGCGRKNALNNGIVLLANGARQVALLEPAEIDWQTSVASARNLVTEIFFNPARYNIAGARIPEMKQRLAALQTETFATLSDDAGPVLDLGPMRFYRSIDDIPANSVDLVFSQSVLEHVMDLAGEVESLNRICTPQALQIHTVDFTAHGKLKADYDPFEFYYQSSDYPKGLNLYRPRDLRDIFGAGGWEVQDCAPNDAAPEEIDMTRLAPRFRDYPPEELVRKQGTFFLRRRNAAA